MSPTCRNRSILTGESLPCLRKYFEVELCFQDRRGACVRPSRPRAMPTSSTISPWRCSDASFDPGVYGRFNKTMFIHVFCLFRPQHLFLVRRFFSDITSGLRRVEGITILVPISQGSSTQHRSMFFGKIGVLNFFYNTRFSLMRTRS